MGAVITLVNWTLYHANAGSGWDEGSFVTTDVNGMADFELGDPTSTGNDSTAVLHYRAENGKTIDEECSSFIY